MENLHAKHNQFSRSFFLATIILFGLALGPGCGSETHSEPSAQWQQYVKVAELKNIAHRGGADLWPEETTQALDQAVAMGVGMLEIDVHASSDGIVVLNHDASVDRTTDGSGKIEDMTFAELLALDAGYQFKENGTYPYRGKGVRIVTLEQVLERYPEQHFSIEIKQYNPPIVDKVLALIEEKDMTDQILIASFDDETILKVRQLAPTIRTSFSMNEMTHFVGSNAKNPDYTPPAEALQMPVALITEETMQRARELDLEVQVWTVNDRTTMRSMMEQQVDGIITDDPVLLEEVRAELLRELMEEILL